MLYCAGRAVGVARRCTSPWERGVNITVATSAAHARVTPRHWNPSVCGAFVAAVPRSCPRFPRRPRMVREGVDGSSPSEGLTLQLRLLVAFSDASPGERCGGVEEAVICRHFSGKRQLSARETVREYRPAVSASLGVGEADAASVVVLTATVVEAPSSAAVFASAAVQTLTDCTVWRPHADQIVGDEFRGERR